jgi:phosphoglycolate phosphatase
MNKRYKLVVFDWEGTLGDTLGQILNVISVEGIRLGLGDFDAPKARQALIWSLSDAVRAGFSHSTPDVYQRLLAAVRVSIAMPSEKIDLLPDARAFVEHLYEMGLILAIATNKGQTSLRQALAATELTRFFTVTRCAGQVPAKPNPQMLMEILEVAAIPVQDALMLGDSPQDMEMAQQVGMDAIGMDPDGLQGEQLRTAGALEVFGGYPDVARYLGFDFFIVGCK